MLKSDIDFEVSQIVNLKNISLDYLNLSIFFSKYLKIKFKVKKLRINQHKRKVKTKNCKYANIEILLYNL